MPKVTLLSLQPKLSTYCRQKEHFTICDDRARKIWRDLYELREMNEIILHKVSEEKRGSHQCNKQRKDREFLCKALLGETVQMTVNWNCTQMSLSTDTLLSQTLYSILLGELYQLYKYARKLMIFKSFWFTKEKTG